MYTSVSAAIMETTAMFRIEFTKSIYNYDLSEGSPVGTIVMLPIELLRYSLQSEGNGTALNASSVSLTAIGGEPALKLLNGSWAFQLEHNIDRETHSIIEISLFALLDGVIGNTSVHISILDVNDNPPVFSNPFYAITVFESTPVGSLIAHITAVDADAAENAFVQYAFSVHSEVFAIDPNSGEVRTITPLSPGNYSLTVNASDSGSPMQSSSVLLIISVLCPPMPSVASWSLDFNVGDLTLEIDNSEGLNVSTVNCSAIQIVRGALDTNHSGIECGSSPLLSGSMLTISLSFIDQYLLSIDSGIATNVSNTFLVIDQHHHIFNDAGSLLPISPASPLQAVTVIPDTTGPVLLSFDLDLNVGVLILQFSEPVRVLNALASAITLQSASNGSGTSYSLTGGLLLSNTSTASLNVRVSMEDLNAVKALFDLPTSSIFLSFTPNIATDYALNAAVPITSSKAVPVASLIPDTTPPMLISFSLDMDAAELLLTYSEAVNASTFVLTQITLENSPGYPSISFTLTSGAVSALSYTVLLVSLSQEDFNGLASEDKLAVSLNTTFLEDDHFAFFYYYSPSSVSDTSGNPSSPVYGLQAATFTADLTSPLLMMFTLDLSLSELNLTFNEPVDVATFDVISVTLQSGPGNMSAMYTLTGGRVTAAGSNTTVMQLTLNENDVVALKLLPELATEYNNTYISFPSGLVTDNNANPVIAVSPEDPLQVTGAMKLRMVCSMFCLHMHTHAYLSSCVRMFRLLMDSSLSDW